MKLQVVLLSAACCVAPTLAFSTRHAPLPSLGARVLSPRLPRSPFGASAQRRGGGAPLRMNAPAVTTPIDYKEPTFVEDCLAGLAVAFSLLSKAIACSAIVGVNPLVGVWSSVVMGLTQPFIGGRRGVISGSAAVVIVPLAVLTRASGVEYMSLCCLVAAIMQGLFGAFRLSPLTTRIPENVISGFLDGVGLYLLLSQAHVFEAAAAAGTLLPSASMAGLCFLIVQFLPLLTKVVPSSLVGLGIASAVGAILKLPLTTLAQKSAPGTFSGGLGSLPSFVDFGILRGQLTSIPALKLVLPAAVTITISSLIETLLAGTVVDGMTGRALCTPDEAGTEQGTKSVLALSGGNALSSLLGGFGGCGLIPQTVLNLNSGGGGKFSSVSYALAMASFVVFFAPLAGQISQAALAGIMAKVAYDTVAWGPTKEALTAVISPSDHPDEEGNAVGLPQRLIELATLSFVAVQCYTGKIAEGILIGAFAQVGLIGIYKKLFSNSGTSQAATA